VQQIGILEMIVWRFSVQGEDSFEHDNGKCHVFYILVCKRKVFMSILMPSVIGVHFRQLVDHIV
jgi:hypothetical protein